MTFFAERIKLRISFFIKIPHPSDDGFAPSEDAFFYNLQRSKKEEKEMKKAVVTVLGLDQVGITAKICTVLAEQNINILDISQTIVGGYFNMVMVVDVAETKNAFNEVTEKLQAVGAEMGMEVKMQHTDIFDAMHRI